MKKKCFVLKENVLRQYFRFEKNALDLKEFTSPESILQVKKFFPNMDDLKVALQYIKENGYPSDSCNAWRDFFLGFMWDKLFNDYAMSAHPLYLYGSWENQAYYTLSKLEAWMYDVSYDNLRNEDVEVGLQNIIADLENYQFDRNDEVFDEFSVLRKEDIFENFAFRVDNIKTNAMDDKEIAVYRQIIQEYADKNNPHALKMLAYDYYGGNKAFPCDWFKARDLMLKLMDVNPENNGQWANTLGYIYYYGRCNNKVPQYDEAFKYFSLGAAYGYFESTYKLADMYLNGKGVPKDERAAFLLTSRYYEECFDRFVRYSDKQSLPDIALRMGSMYQHGNGVEKNLKSALWYYLIADYAQRERMKHSDFFGEQKVFDSIQKGLAECKEELGCKPESKTFETYEPIGAVSATREKYAIKVKFKEIKDGLRIITTRFSQGHDTCALIPVILPGKLYCNFMEETTDYAVDVKKFWVEDDKKVIFADSVSYANHLERVEFRCFGKLVAYIKCKRFVYKLNKK